MFDHAATSALLGQARAFDFDGLAAGETGVARIEAIKALDVAIRSAQAEQLTQINALHAERIELMGIGSGDPTLSVIGEISMARTIGLTAASTQVGLAVALERMPKVFALFTAGVISEATARAVTTETACLSVDDFCVADAELADKLPGMTTPEARQAAARVVISIDAEAARVRAERNRADQRISLHPEPDGVATLIVRGPAEQLLAAHKTLDDLATALRAAGDTRTRGQIMVQTLVERVTGVAFADEVNVEVNLVMDAETLFNAGDTPVDLVGYGPIAPDVADHLLARAKNTTIRRLLTDPVDGTLLRRENRRRNFDPPSKAHIRARDKICRQPGCDLKIRDHDHIFDYQHGGETTIDNGQGLCKRSHTLKHLPGWHVTGNGQITTWTTPTGHTYTSKPPPVLPRNDLGHLRQ